MIRLSLASLVGLFAALAVAWRLGGTLGSGVMIGFLLGAAMSGLGVLYQRHLLVVHPERSLTAFVATFLVKLGLLVSGGLVFRFVDAAAARADWRSFLVAFAAAVVIVLPLGTFDAVQSFRRQVEVGSR